MSICVQNLLQNKVQGVKMELQVTYTDSEPLRRRSLL